MRSEARPRRSNGGFRILLPVTLLMLSGQHASAASGAYTYEGRCTEATTFVPLDPNRVRDEVPGIASYRMAAEGSGRVLGFVNQGRCTAVEIDGEPVGEFTFSDAGVAIDSPDDTGGSHAYVFWNVVDHPGLHQRSCALGACFRLAKLTFDLNPPVPDLTSPEASTDWMLSRSLRASTEWAISRSSMSATIADAAVAGVGNHGVVVWTQGHRGPVRTTFLLTDEVDAVGVGLLGAERGSKLARILGTEEVQTDVFLRRFRFKASPALVV